MRHLFLVGYDIASHRNRRKALKLLKGTAIGGQKSLYECWLTSAELQLVMASIKALLDTDRDRAVFVRMDPRAAVHTLGKAVPPADGEYFYLG